MQLSCYVPSQIIPKSRVVTKDTHWAIQKSLSPKIPGVVGGWYLARGLIVWGLHMCLASSCVCSHVLTNAFHRVRGLCAWFASSCVCSHVLTNAFHSVRGLRVCFASSCVYNHTLTNAFHRVRGSCVWFASSCVCSNLLTDAFHGGSHVTGFI